jgi:hypothetical protein
MDKKPTDKAAAWIKDRLAYIRGLKQPTDQQRLLLLLADLPTRTPDQDRQLAALIRAERAADRYAKARGAAARIVDAEKRAARKARDHERYKAAGLMGQAGLLDQKTGQPIVDHEVILGGLLEIAQALSDPARMERYRRAGRAAAAGDDGQAAPPPPPAPPAPAPAPGPGGFIVHPDTEDL